MARDQFDKLRVVDGRNRRATDRRAVAPEVSVEGAVSLASAAPGPAQPARQASAAMPILLFLLASAAGGGLVAFYDLTGWLR